MLFDTGLSARNGITPILHYEICSIKRDRYRLINAIEVPINLKGINYMNTVLLYHKHNVIRWESKAENIKMPIMEDRLHAIL